MSVIDFPDQTEHAIDGVHAELLQSLQRLSVVNQTQVLAAMLGEIVAANIEEMPARLEYLALMHSLSTAAAELAN